ncbi:MAG: hypothetical protein FWH35_08900, partial [Treponema sp.]|nr:hypothetical protein [Treponema sp.]
DNYEPDVDESFCAGYFWAGNFFAYEDDFQSNECDMIYVDTYPGLDYMEVVYSTMAHELQHLMNFITTILDRSIITGGVLKNIFPMDTWIDEGLSSAAEWVYTGKHLDSRIRDYNEDISGLIAKGNNFFVWDNRNDEHIYAVLDDYSTVYLFFQWLRLQAGSPEIYFDIITSSNENYKAVSNSINKYKPGNGFNNWGTLLKTWMAANRINAETGIYGYMGDATLKKLDKKTVPSGTAGSLSLYPGEGVYSKATSSTMPTNTTYIQYAGLTAITLSDTVISSGDTLLTYNVNTSMKGPKIPGTVGASANVDINIEDLPRSARRGPFPIGAGDILSRNGFKREFPSGFNGLPKGAFIRD